MKLGVKLYLSNIYRQGPVKITRQKNIIVITLTFMVWPMCVCVCMFSTFSNVSHDEASDWLDSDTLPLWLCMTLS